jgi:hypothetical protein
LFRAVRSFLETNANFESSIFQRQVLEDLGAAATLDALYTAALQLHVFDMGAALTFGLLLSQAPRLAEAAGDPAGLAPLDEKAALGLLAQVYDLGFAELVGSHFEEEEEEESDEESGSEGSEAESEAESEGGVIGGELL